MIQSGLELSQALERLDLGLQSPHRPVSLVAVAHDVSGHSGQPPRIDHSYPAPEPDGALFLASTIQLVRADAGYFTTPILAVPGGIRNQYNSPAPEVIIGVVK